jgi:hypothetical protein
VSRDGNKVGEYDATTGAAVNSSFITGLNVPLGIALDGNNHLFVTNAGNNTVGEYNATTGGAINPAFINGQGLNAPSELLLVTPTPEPSAMLILATAAGIGGGTCRRRWERRTVMAPVEKAQQRRVG